MASPASGQNMARENISARGLSLSSAPDTGERRSHSS
jgi:hypothetical protein